MLENPKNRKLVIEALRKWATAPNKSPNQKQELLRLAQNVEALGRALNKRDWLRRLENEPPAGSA